MIGRWSAALLCALVPAAWAQEDAPALAVCEAALPHDNALPIPWHLVDTMSQVMEEVADRHVAQPNDEVLFQHAIRGLVRSLDPHSDILDNASIAAITSAPNADAGLGFVLDAVDRDLIVTRVDVNGSAAQAGLNRGDIVVSINDIPVNDIGLPGVAALLASATGTVSLEVRRHREHGRVDITPRGTPFPQIVRESLSDGLAHLTLHSFHKRNVPNIKQELLTLSAQLAQGSLRALVIDVRGGRGGSVDAALDVADQLIDGGLIGLIETPDATNGLKKRFALPGELLPGVSISVLVDDTTHGAAETFAAALQDRGRAKLVGAITYGHGLVQDVVPLRSGTSLVLTTGFALTPSGSHIQGNGIFPDLLLPLPLSSTPKISGTLLPLLRNGRPMTGDRTWSEIAQDLLAVADRDPALAVAAQLAVTHGRIDSRKP